jgi:hypothetical protein
MNDRNDYTRWVTFAYHWLHGGFAKPQAGLLCVLGLAWLGGSRICVATGSLLWLHVLHAFHPSASLAVLSILHTHSK